MVYIVYSPSKVTVVISFEAKVLYRELIKTQRSYHKKKKFLPLDDVPYAFCFNELKVNMFEYS